MIFQTMQKGWGKIKQALKRARETLMGPLLRLLGRELDGETLEELEQLFYEADFGVQLTQKMISALRLDTLQHGQRSQELRLDVMKNTILQACHLDVDLQKLWQPKIVVGADPYVIFVAGINGSGKTTSIAKLAHYYKQQGHTVLLAAGDTFRAGAAQQLSEWAGRVGVDIVQAHGGADPSSIVFDALSAAKARGATLVLVDTAGRLQNKELLMQELSKMIRVAGKAVKGAPHATVFVLDAVTGQHALLQAQAFSEVSPISGVILTKIDGAAKGGMALALQNQQKLPIVFLGTGEGLHDLQPFSLKAFVDNLFQCSFDS